MNDRSAKNLYYVIHRVVGSFTHENNLFIILFGYALIAIVGFFDYITGTELSFSVLYVFPIALIGWYAGSFSGILASLVSVVVWVSGDLLAGLHASVFTISWNSIISFTFFIVIVTLLHELKISVQHATALLHTDHLTGATSARYFYELLQEAADQAAQSNATFTLVYLDVDNLHSINDDFGYDAGDSALCITVDYLRKKVRTTDVIARVGGDEFALLFTEADRMVVHAILSGIQSGFSAEMEKHGFQNITLSIGALTCTTPPSSIYDLIRMAAILMQAVKRNDKNGTKYDTFRG